MIVARGLGRKVTGATGIIAAVGLGLVGVGGTDTIPGRPPVTVITEEQRIIVRIFDDIDILELVPIIVEVLNGRR
jgi:hypothetical protein